MGMSKEEFVEKMMRNELGKKQTKLNKAIREGKATLYNADACAFKQEMRTKQAKTKRSKDQRFY